LVADSEPRECQRLQAPHHGRINQRGGHPDPEPGRLTERRNSCRRRQRNPAREAECRAGFVHLVATRAHLARCATGSGVGCRHRLGRASITERLATVIAKARGFHVENAACCTCDFARWECHGSCPEEWLRENSSLTDQAAVREAVVDLCDSHYRNPGG